MLFSVLNLLGAFALFIYGMKVMSDAVQRVAGSRLRNILSAVASNRFSAMTTGFLVTALIQSSSAVTVMVVSFVNAGMLALNEAVFLIMGANIGTTMTAWLVGLLGLGQFSFSSIALPIIGFGLLLMAFKREGMKAVSESIIGFGLLFLGLSLLKDGLPRIHESDEVIAFLREFGNPTGNYFRSLWSYLIFIVTGLFFTVLLQSSSVATAFTLLLLSQGWISLPFAMALVIGENIGTTVTANLAAVVANVHGKRAARFHLLFNVIGATWMLFLLPVFVPLVTAIAEGATTSIHQENIFYTLSLAAFHTAFNVVNTLIFLVTGLHQRSIQWLNRMMPSKVEGDEEYHLEFLSASLMGTSELSIVEVRRELIQFGKHAQRAYSFLPKILLEADDKAQEQYLEQIERIERISDKMELDIANYLGKISASDISPEASQRIRNMLSASNYMERVCDLILKIGIFMVRRKQEKAYFPPDLRRSLIEYMQLVQCAMDLMLQSIAKDPSQIDLKAVRAREKEIDERFESLKKSYLRDMERKRLKVQSGLYYHDLINELERLGDHVENVSEALAGAKA